MRPATPTVILTVQAGQGTALLTAQVLNAGLIFPTGTVQFSEGTTALGQPVTLAQVPPGTPPTASLQVPLTPGTHTISASYAGDLTDTLAAASPVTVVIAGPPPGTSLCAGHAVPRRRYSESCWPVWWPVRGRRNFTRVRGSR